MSGGSSLQFAPFSSSLDAGFWQRLSENKLNVYGLDEAPQTIHGFYFNGDPAGMVPRLSVDFTAFDSEWKTPPRCLASKGSIQNTNTLERFKECDKKELLETAGKQIWDDIISGRAVDDPSLLSRFLLLTHADLKKYNYYYWFAFPCLTAPENTVASAPQALDSRFSPELVKSFLASYDAFQAGRDCFEGFFTVKEEGNAVLIQELKTLDVTDKDKGKVMFGFCDPCSLDKHPGWPLRNFLTLIAHRWGDKLGEIEVLCLRDRTRDGVRDISHSLVLSITLTSLSAQTECPKCVGWEKNERQKLGPRMVNLSSSMDPTKLAESAVDLNLRLMRWRLLPDLDLEKISSTKVLLLGSGTLGCNVARGLMGWGIRKITFVDNSRISYSNPVRQSLFTFEDCLNGGKPKAQAAAESLRKIFPGAETTGLTLSIPMPGHSVSESSLESVRQDVETLEKLVESHDVLFLLMDTRESRWLPTVLGGVKQKIVMNAALGFDTFLVLRHGYKTAESAIPPGPISLTTTIPGCQLGCYFCNDVVAPGNSTRDRTLDQQCTVTRPGISMIAGALAVELLVSILQHPKGPEAPADTTNNDDIFKDSDCSLGLVPHQIRGFLSRFHNVLPASRAFDKCTACSTMVLETYKKEGFQFLLRAFNEPNYLEDLTGLTQMQQETLDAEVWDLSDDDSGSMEMS
ncbi:ubiquitin-like modifier-activating enzyme ATG7 [Haliotis cracherodii]|uniref:ubiquitin-like modifier-activating enzyme ATG7 n=1 Tax=Haliotis cracherodii TaxID=6455 RepID=UPI0039E927E5